MHKWPALLAVLPMVALLVACGKDMPATSAFETTGEIIALSGGDAGARGACATCHGLNGEGDGNLVPRLAGLDPGYQLRQLEYFAQGQRRHPQMVWIADQLDWPAREKVANYYAALPVPDAAGEELAAVECTAATLYQRGDPARGLPACATCHGADGAGVGAGNPPLAHQPAPYVEAQLHQWANGERYGASDAMTAVSRLLTEREMAHLAVYSSGLPGASGYRAPPASCP
ncbi:c-type cytochrome [Croceicoccus sp. YJ47]|uniref:c-type cytochrome n=1 Tax=Croceicoccus sp. YJ47 TaxID=2798724 RepID=UPI001920BB59|nr:c-type cytochrome [Croceicoccus sp. YJ47]QQN75342.1 c-type cytochrome [Croceicoccus sp. YJ47]